MKLCYIKIVKKTLFSISIFFFLCFFTGAVEMNGIEVQVGLIHYGYTGDARLTSSPLKENLGIVVPLSLGERLELRPGLSLFYFDYFFDETDGRTVPAAVETSGRISVFHILLNPALAYILPLNEIMDLRFSFSPSFLFRMPLAASDDGEQYRDDMTGYFYAAGRFFYPSLGCSYAWQFAEKTALCIGISGYLPLFHLWDGSSEPFNDQLMISMNTGFHFTF